MRLGSGISSAILVALLWPVAPARADEKPPDTRRLQDSIASWNASLMSAPNLAVKAETEDRIGNAFVELQDFAPAIARLESAWKDARAAGDVELYCRCQEDLADAYDKSSRSSPAAGLEEGLLTWYVERGRSEDALRVRAKLAGAYYRTGHHKRSLNLYEEVLKEYRLRGRTSEIANIEYRIGRTLFAMGKYDAAQRHFAESRRLAPDEARLMLRVEFVQGLISMELGDENDALTHLARVSEAAKALGDDVTRTDALGDMARINFYSLGKPREALAQYREEAADYVRMGVSTEDVTTMMFEINLNSGDLKSAQRNIGDNAINGAQWELASGHYERALALFRDCAAKYAAGSDGQLMWAIQTGIGQSLLGMHRAAEALPAFALAQKYIEENRDTLQENERGNYFSAPVSYSSSRTLPYEGEMEALVALGRPDEAFRIAEHLKARMLGEAIARGGSGSELPPELRSREADLRARVRDLRLELDALLEEEDAAKSASKEKELYEAKNAEDRFYRELSGMYAEYAAVNHPKPLGPNQVRLRAHEYLAEFQLTRDRGYLFLLAPDGKLETRVIPAGREAIRSVVAAYRRQFEDVRSASDLASFDPAKGKALFDLLFGSLLDRLGADEKLTIVPDDLLGILPFEALVVHLPAAARLGSGEHGPFPLGVRYLADRAALSYAQSATSLTLGRALRRAGAAPDDLLIVADPVFSEKDSRIAQSSAAAASPSRMLGAIGEWKTLGVSGTRERGTGGAIAGEDAELFPRLQKTGALAESLRRLYGAHAVALTGAAATKERLLTLPLGRYRDIVFATHGILDETLPYVREPALVLGRAGPGDPREEFLSMHEVLALHLHADVVALTACQTGIGRNARGEGVMGMGRAFQYAGASNVLMSLWSVAEDASVALTDEYFHAVHEGLSPRAALKSARAAVRHRGYENPFYWAGFILMGD